MQLYRKEPQRIFLAKPTLKKIKLNQGFYAKETFRSKSILKLMDFLWYWVLSTENSHPKTLSQDFLINIKIYCTGILIFKFKSPSKKNELVNQELFKRHFNEVSQVSLF